MNAATLRRIAGVLICTPLLLANEGGCDNSRAAPNAAAVEQNQANQAQVQLLRNQPVPVFDYSLERHMLTEIYKARQRATNTFSVVQSEYSGHVLFSCPSLGYPIPYATQLTNPLQAQWRGSSSIAGVAIAQQEPNGLYSPAQADATWIPCVAADGRVTPVYEEKHVTVFLQPMQDDGAGRLIPIAGSKPSFGIDPQAAGGSGR